jgi:serine/threonine protein kinase
MASPASAVAFLELLRKSSLVEEKVLEAQLQKLRDSSQEPKTAGEAARALVTLGLISRFQAERLLEGRWRGFFLGKYKIQERLGAGGMGSVYLCEHKFMRRRVAVKVLPGSHTENRSALERFYREARAVAALDHPNIVRAYDIDQDEGIHFLIMEYIDGSSLQDLVRNSGPLPISTAANYIQQAALGLQHAHEQAGLVHRDIKPDNILVDRKGVVKILDMGLARFFQDPNDLLTQRYDERVYGTVDYLAPEQVVDGSNVDIRADIYSLGATFYFCLSGQTLFGEAPEALKMIWQQVRQPKPIGSQRADVPEQVAQIVDKMLAKAPGQRFQTPREIAEALLPWCQVPAASSPRDKRDGK